MKIAGRYEVGAKLGQGGMGVVYRAYDPAPMDREVAVKTLHEFTDPLALDLFYKECRALKSISHPNIVEIFDIGEFEEGGLKKPYFVMPLLPGKTLDELIRSSSHRLTVDRVVEIISQTCRGLQAAHERGLVHRDLKPSNIFVMADDSVKLIDFGVAHAVTARSRTTGFDKGTLLYMAPEQVQHKPVSAQSDVYALGLTMYEALTRRHPFRGATESAVVQAILTQIPQPASDLNPAVSHLVSRAVHKAIAKQPWNRYDTAREFGETLQKALRNEPIPMFDPARMQPRIRTASKALEKGDYQFAGEIVSELESEGNLDPEITMLRAQVDQMARKKALAQLLESARARYEEEEDPLALQKIHEVLQLDPTNVTALGLKGKIEDRRSERQFEKWINLARQHVDNHSYTHAHEALQNAITLRPKDSRASRLLKEVESAEQEYVRMRREKTDLYEAAVNAWKNGDVSHALSQMKHVLELDARAPDAASAANHTGVYQSFYDKIRSEHDAINNGYAQARRYLADRDFANAIQTCHDFLERYPGHSLFHALKFDIEEQERQHVSEFIADVNRRMDAEADLDSKLNLVREVAAQHPDEVHFARLSKTLEDKRDLVNSIVERARLHEARGQFSEALADLDTLQTIYGTYPGLSFEKDRLRKRLEQHTRDAARARWMVQVRQQLDGGDYARATGLLDKAQAEYPENPELEELRKLAIEGLERVGRADVLLAEGQRLCAEGDLDGGIESLRSALHLDDRSLIRITLRDLLVARAQASIEHDWAAAERFADSALEVDPNHALAKSLRARALDKKQDDIVEQSVTRVRSLLAAGDIATASHEVQQALTMYPGDDRLLKLRNELKTDFAETNAPGRLTATPSAARATAAASTDGDLTLPGPHVGGRSGADEVDVSGETILRPQETVLKPPSGSRRRVDTSAQTLSSDAGRASRSNDVVDEYPATIQIERPAPIEVEKPAPTPVEKRSPVRVERQAPIPVEQQREPFSPQRLFLAIGSLVGLVALTIAIAVWPSGAPDDSAAQDNVSPVGSPAGAEPPAATVPTEVALPKAPAPAPPTEFQPPPTVAPPPPPPPAVAQTPAPRPSTPLPARGASPSRPRPVESAPAPSVPAAVTAPPVQVAPPPAPPAPVQVPGPPVNQPPAPAPAANSTSPAPRAGELLLPPVLAPARAAQLLDLAGQSEKARDWPTALRNYESARAIDPALSALVAAAIARIQPQMLAEGTDAFKRARQYDALNRVDDAIAWYERASRNLPDAHPDKRTAGERIAALKAIR